MDNGKKVVLCYSRDTLEPVELLEEDRFLNMLVIGPTGTGKSSQIFTPLIFQDLMNQDCGVTVIDPKEDLAEFIYSLRDDFPTRNIIYVDPTNEFCPKINPFKGSEEVVIKNLLKIFSPTFLTTSNAEKQEIELNRNLLIKSITLLKRFPSLCGDNLNIKTFADFISNRYNEPRAKIAKLVEVLKRESKSFDLVDICEWFYFNF